MKKLDYTLVVPSRKRSGNMPLLRSLLPSATICIDEREKADYLERVPKGKLLLHPPIEGFGPVFNWMIENVTSPIFIEVDDDFVGVHVTTGSKRFITDPDDILAILENSARVCADLEMTTFCYSRTPNATIVRPSYRPIVPVQSVCAAFGIMGAARHRKYDRSFPGRDDVDWTLRTFLEDRAVLADIRFYFDCGRAFGGKGGNVGIITPEDFEGASRRLRKKWGNAMSFKPLAFAKKRDVAAIKIAVSRTNKAAIK